MYLLGRKIILEVSSLVRILVVIPGLIEAFVACYNSKQNLQVKGFYYSTYSPLYCMHLLQPTYNPSRPFSEKDFVYFSKTIPVQLLSPLR